MFVYVWLCCDVVLSRPLSILCLLLIVPYFSELDVLFCLTFVFSFCVFCFLCMFAFVFLWMCVFVCLFVVCVVFYVCSR